MSLAIGAEDLEFGYFINIYIFAFYILFFFNIYIIFFFYYLQKNYIYYLQFLFYI